jgi:hypothetical protein
VARRLLIGWPVTDIKDNTRMVLALMPGGPQLEQTQYTRPDRPADP